MSELLTKQEIESAMAEHLRAYAILYNIHCCRYGEYVPGQDMDFVSAEQLEKLIQNRDYE